MIKLLKILCFLLLLISRAKAQTDFIFPLKGKALLTGNYDILGINALANDNVVLLQNEDTQLPEIYVAGQGSYSVAQLATKLKLIDSIEYTSIAISPNGNYLSFDVQSYKNNIFGVKVYFPQGVAAYLHNNLTTINKKEHHDA